MRAPTLRLVGTSLGALLVSVVAVGVPVGASPASAAAEPVGVHGGTGGTALPVVGDATAMAATTEVSTGQTGAQEAVRQSGTDNGAGTVGENPPGRVSQGNGFGGYNFGYQDDANLQYTFTVPGVSQGTNSPSAPGWPNNLAGSQAAVGLYNGSWGVQVFLDWNSGGDSWNGDRVLSSMDRCGEYTGCPTYQPGIYPGDSVELWLDTATTTDTTGGVIDLTNGNSYSWTGPALSDPQAQVQMGEEDYCFTSISSPPTNDNPCSSTNGGASTPPPGMAGYGTLDITDAQVNGQPLGTVLNGSSLAFWAQDNSVWGSTLNDESTYVGTGSSFTVTNVSTGLPTASVAVAGAADIDRPAKGTATFTFNISLSFALSHDVYVDYATSDGVADPAPGEQSATSGDDYQGTAAYAYFPAGQTEVSVPVTILSGPSSGGDHGFTFTISNPSYAVIGTSSATALIHEGPVVYSVVESPVPLSGGGAPMTVTGADFGPAGTADRVEVCDIATYGGTANCVRVSKPVVQSDTEITYVAPDATTLQPVGVPLFFVDTIVTNPDNVSSPITSDDEVQYGCNTESIGAGSYTASGCFTPEPWDSGVNATQTTSTIDGAVVVSATKSDLTDYGTGVVTSSGSSTTIGLNVAGQIVNIFKGQLDEITSQPLTFTVPPDTSLLGMQLSGSLTMTAQDSGSLTGSVSVTLPPIIGAQSASGGSTTGATGTLSFSASAGSEGTVGGLTNITVTVPSANFMNLFSLSNVVLQWAAPGTWMVTGTATSGGGNSSDFTGNLTYAGNTLTAGSLTISSIPVLGMFTVNDFAVTYSGSSWSGSGTVVEDQGGSPISAAIAVAFKGSVMTSGSFTTNGPVTLFGAINVTAFSLQYKASKWSLALSTSIKGSASAVSLDESNGVISQASFTMKKVQFFGLTIDSAAFGYSLDGPYTNAACAGPNGDTVPGSQIWCAALQVTLVGKATVAGSVAFDSDGFYQGQLSASSITVPLGEGVTLTSIGAGLSLPSAGTGLVIQGEAGITFGPIVAGNAALLMNSQVTLSFDSSGNFLSVVFNGSLVALPNSSDTVLGTASVTLPASGPAQFALTVGGGPSGLQLLGGNVVVTGSLNGTFASKSSYSITGSGGVTVLSAGPVAAGFKLDDTAFSGCGSLGGFEIGFQYVWATGDVVDYPSSGCKLA